MMFDKVPAWLSDNEKATDIEVVMRLLRLMDEPEAVCGAETHHRVQSIYVKMAEDALEKMTNPFARALLLDKIKA